MSFTRPTINDIWERVKGDIRSGLGLTAILRRSFEFALGKAITGASHELHGRATWIAKQQFVDQMDDEYLDRFGTIYALPRKEATYTTLNVTFTGDEGTSIPIATQVQRSDGVVYETDEALIVETTTVAVAEETEITTVADSSGSLNSTYFLLNSPTNNYYVWLNVDGTGVDPLYEDYTGVEVAIASNDTANTVATLVRTEIENLSDFNTTVALNVITVTNVATGVVDNPTDGAAPTGFFFLVTIEGVDAITGGSITGTVIAVDVGAGTNTEDGDILTLVGAITGIDSQVTVVSTDTEGEDSETDDSYRARLLARVRQAPHGGNANDYIQWALAVPGITRAWVLPDQLGAGTVLVYVVEDDEGDIFPDVAKIEEVQTYINGVRPITADVTVVSPTPVDLDLTISISPNTPDVRAAVEAEIRDMLYRYAVPHGVLKDAGQGTTYDGSILISKINEAISIAEGEEDHVLVSPTTNITVTTGQMVRLGTISWQVLS